jgi:hypothetical protein
LFSRWAHCLKARSVVLEAVTPSARGVNHFKVGVNDSPKPLFMRLHLISHLLSPLSSSSPALYVINGTGGLRRTENCSGGQRRARWEHGLELNAVSLRLGGHCVWGKHLVLSSRQGPLSSGQWCCV